MPGFALAKAAEVFAASKRRGPNAFLNMVILPLTAKESYDQIIKNTKK